jgi:hypothetical protein
MSDTKKAGCCTLCDNEVYEVRSYFPMESILAGFPRKLGKPLPSARKVSYALRDGSHCDLTCCETCEPAMRDPAQFPALWQKVLRTFLFEERDDVRALLPAPVRTPTESAHIQKELQALSNNQPIAVICVTSWSNT